MLLFALGLSAILFVLPAAFAHLSLILSVKEKAKMSTSGLKAIAPVPKASDFLDIVLSKTQRKTPTVCLCFAACVGVCSDVVRAGYPQKL